MAQGVFIVGVGCTAFTKVQSISTSLRIPHRPVPIAKGAATDQRSTIHTHRSSIAILTTRTDGLGSRNQGTPRRRCVPVYSELLRPLIAHRPCFRDHLRCHRGGIRRLCLRRLDMWPGRTLPVRPHRHPNYERQQQLRDGERRALPRCYARTRRRGALRAGTRL